MKKLISFTQEPIRFSREIMGGLTNFMAIAYIISLNPMILNAGGKGFPLNASITATIVSIIILTTLVGFIIKLPFVIAPGMGLNAIISYTMIVGDKMPIPIALGVIFWSSVLLLIFSVTPLRQRIINAIPQVLQVSLSVGIGLFLLFIGLKEMGLIVSDPITLLAIGKISMPILLSFCGVLITVMLFKHKKAYAFILPVIIITLVSFLLNETKMPVSIIDYPDFSLFMQINFLDSFTLSLLPAILSLFLINFFDATSTLIGLLSQLECKDKNLRKVYFKRSLIADCLGGMVCGSVGTSPGVLFVESFAAIQSGARTGLASIITALACVPFLFLSPVISAIPSSATSPILVVVGVLMMWHVRYLKLDNVEDLVASVLTIVMMPFCFSITAGAVFGIISYTLFKIVLGKWAELNIDLFIVALVCCGWFWVN